MPSDAPKRVAFLYTGQPRAFSVAWQHANHLEMLVNAPDALFHEHGVSVFMVMPEDSHWKSSRSQLLKLPNLVNLVSYDTQATVTKVYDRDADWQHLAHLAERCVPLSFKWPPIQTTPLESRLKLFWKPSETGTPVRPMLIAGLQLSIAAHAMLHHEHQLNLTHDMFVRLRLDSLFYAPFTMPAGALGERAHATLLAHDVRLQDVIFWGGRRVLQWVYKRWSPCSSGGPPHGVVNETNARAHGIERFITGPGGAPVALIRTNRARRCVFVAEYWGGMLGNEHGSNEHGSSDTEQGQTTCCDDQQPGLRDSEQRLGFIRGDGGLFDPNPEFVHQIEHAYRLGRSITKWTDAGLPVHSWYAQIRYPANAFCTSCETIKVLSDLEEAVRASGLTFDAAEDSPNCRSEADVSSQGRWEDSGARGKQVDALRRARVGDEVSIFF